MPIILLTILFLLGCNPPSPVPEAAIKACLDAGRVPDYKSTQVAINFECKEKEKS